jgi:hypothetical protein
MAFQLLGAAKATDLGSCFASNSFFRVHRTRLSPHDEDNDDVITHRII